MLFFSRLYISKSDESRLISSTVTQCSGHIPESKIECRQTRSLQITSDG